MNAPCGAKTRTGAICKHPAGWGTDHIGEGRCKLHGGNAGRPVVHGRYSTKHKQALTDKAAEFLNDPMPLDLTDELALARALLQEYLSRFDNGVPFPASDIERIMNLIELITRLVERIAKIANQTALTQAEMQFLAARIADTVAKYIDDPIKQREFIAAIFGEMGQPQTRGRAEITASV